jgi:nucleotide-binding universal stress UspA family protein
MLRRGRTGLYKRILIPTDGSRCSEIGVRYGLRLAKHAGARVILIHVLEPLPTVTHAGYPAYVTTERDAEEGRKVGEQALARAQRLAQRSRVPAEVRLAGPASPAEAIAEVAEKVRCDLIVMASHGRSGVRRIVLGSVTEGVLRSTRRSLLVVRCPEE